MHFNFYIDDQTGQQLNAAAERFGRSRNSLIREAVEEWIARHMREQWPDAVMKFSGEPDFPALDAPRSKP